MIKFIQIKIRFMMPTNSLAVRFASLSPIFETLYNATEKESSGRCCLFQQCLFFFCTSDFKYELFTSVYSNVYSTSRETLVSYSFDWNEFVEQKMTMMMKTKYRERAQNDETQSYQMALLIRTISL